jgi:hypothetical protein
MARLIPLQNGSRINAHGTVLRAAFCDRPYRNAAFEGPQWLAADSAAKIRQSRRGPPPAARFQSRKSIFQPNFRAIVSRPISAAAGVRGLWHGICISGKVSGGPNRSANPLVRWGLWLTPGVRSPCP